MLIGALNCNPTFLPPHAQRIQRTQALQIRADFNWQHFQLPGYQQAIASLNAHVKAGGNAFLYPATGTCESSHRASLLFFTYNSSLVGSWVATTSAT